MRVAVLQGGLSAEREVSLSSGKAVCAAVSTLGHDCHTIDAGADLVEQLHRIKPDCVFNALHGRYGEDGSVQGILEWLKIPYTHSGLLASALAMDKPMAKRVFAQAGLRCAKGGVFTRAQMLAGDVMPRPFVVKPLNEGSSVGVTIVQESDDFRFDDTNWHFGEAVLVEQYISGREIQVAVLDDAALGAIEIVPLGGFYDYEAKYTDGKAKHLMPAPIPPAAYSQVCELALRAHQALGCRGLTRSDFRYNDPGDGEFYLLEVNTQPGMTPLSLAPEIAAHSGITFNELVGRLLAGARLDG